MRRLLVVFALVLAILLPAVAKGQLPTFQLSQELLDFIAAAPASDDVVAGEGKFAPTEKGESRQFTISAHGSGVFGTPAKGNFRININGVQRKGTVECLHVSGTTTLIEGAFTEPVEFEGQTFPDFVVFAHDGGEPNGEVPRDSARIHLDPLENRCSSFATREMDGDFLVQGNIVVMDRL
jgi:hypothetical protein